MSLVIFSGGSRIGNISTLVLVLIDLIFDVHYSFLDDWITDDGISDGLRWLVIDYFLLGDLALVDYLGLLLVGDLVVLDGAGDWHIGISCICDVGCLNC